MNPEFKVREAKSSDKNAVLRFCKNTFEWGDYIPDVWDYWITDPNGKIFVATYNDMPVGMGHVSILKPGEAWLEGGRTAPELRRRGVASSINEACLRFAIEKGAKVARLVTDSTNIITQKALAKFGFKQISEWAFMVLDGCKFETSKNTTWAEKSDIEKIWEFLVTSKCYARSAGLYSVLFRWLSLDHTDLERFIKGKKAIVYRDDGEVKGLVLIDDTIGLAWGEKCIQTCYVDGNHPAALNMGRFLKAYCYEEGIAKIYGFMLNLKSLTSAFAKLGFRKQESTELVYEKELT